MPIKTCERAIAGSSCTRTLARRGQANYKNYVLLFIVDGNLDNSPNVLAFVKTPDGFRRTNALSADDTFDIVWSALRLGEVKPVK